MFMTSLQASYNRPIGLYHSEQIQAREQAWFDEGHDSFGLMQQAAWQMTQHITDSYDRRIKNAPACLRGKESPRASVWVGGGNNGGDGWLIAHYLQHAGWQVQVVTVGINKQDVTTDQHIDTDSDKDDLPDVLKAQRKAHTCQVLRFEDYEDELSELKQADVYVDALFGIGLDRAPQGVYKKAILAFNQHTSNHKSLAIAVDVPSGLVASTGQVFKGVGVNADITLCLIARKLGLHTKDGVDHSGIVIDIPLIPNVASKPCAPLATLVNQAHCFSPRRQNSYKGSYGHVLVIAGNQIEGSQGMGGAAILSSASSMAAGAGKITVACHRDFHGALLTSLPDAMTINLHDKEGVTTLIKDASLIAIGMGLGRDKKAQELFVSYLQAAIAENKRLVIDADGLYHLAQLQARGHDIIATLKAHSQQHTVCFTPHSGEAAKMLDKDIDTVENDRLAAIKACAERYGGNWVLKGAGSLVLEQTDQQTQIYVCKVGNSGMATAGMGDVLSGVIAGLLAQEDIADEAHSLHQAVLIHGLAGDVLVKDEAIDECNTCSRMTSRQRPLLIGQRGLQAQDMPYAIRHVIDQLTV